MTTRHGSATFEFNDRTVTMQRKFEAPMALVFEALTNPEHIRLWFAADDVALHVCEVDLRVGGNYRHAWYAPGGKECSFRGTFSRSSDPRGLSAPGCSRGGHRRAVREVELRLGAGPRLDRDRDLRGDPKARAAPGAHVAHHRGVRARVALGTDDLEHARREQLRRRGDELVDALGPPVVDHPDGRVHGPLCRRPACFSHLETVAGW